MRIADYVVDPARNVVRGPNGETHLEPRLVDLVLALAARPGAVVSRSELIDTVWNGACGADQSLSWAVSRLRKALGDERGSPRIIETIPKRDYRLVAQVRAVESPLEVSPAAAERRWFPLRRWMVIAPAALAILVAMVALLPPSGSDEAVPGAAVPPAPQGLTVLPLRSLSAAPEDAYVADGLSEELIGALARLPSLKVAGRTSSFYFKGRNEPLAEIAAALGVDYVLEGSVRRSGQRIRVTAQLVDADSGFSLWSESYDRGRADIFAIQDEIARAVAMALGERLGHGIEPAPSTVPPVQPAAYEAYLLGQHLVRKRTSRDIEASIVHFERAIELDPDFAPAHAALGLAWFLLNTRSYGSLTEEQARARSRLHIERALKIDPELAEAHALKGLVLAWAGRNQEAIEQYEAALRLNPSLTDVRPWYANALEALGRISEARSQVESAYHIDPMSTLALVNYANGLVRQKRFAEVEPLMARLELLNPAWAVMIRSEALVAQGRTADGIIFLLRNADVIDRSPDDFGRIALHGLIDLGLGREARRFARPAAGGDLLRQISSDALWGLEAVRSAFDADPDNLDMLARLAWAHWIAGDEVQAEALAERYLDRLDPAVRAADLTNLIFVLEDWTRGAREAVLERLRPLEARWDANFAAGYDDAHIHWLKAIAAFLRGTHTEAREHAERAVSFEPLPPWLFDLPYRYLGWQASADFVEIKERYLARIRAGRLKLLEAACGEEGFAIWQPLPETCAELTGG